MTSRGRILRAFWALTVVIVLAILAFALRGAL